MQSQTSYSIIPYTIAMPGKKWSISIVLLVSAVSFGVTDPINGTSPALLRNKLEEALINSTDNLFVLQKAFLVLQNVNPTSFS